MGGREGWRSGAASHVDTDGRDGATLLTGWKPDRVHGNRRREHGRLRHADRRWRAHSPDVPPRDGPRARLDAGRQAGGLRIAEVEPPASIISAPLDDRARWWASRATSDAARVERR